MILILGCTAGACNRSMKPAEYKSWIESSESGLNKSKKIGQLEYKIQYVTREYAMILNLGPRGFSPSLNINESLENYSEDMQVIFSIKNLNGVSPLKYKLKDEMEYYARIQYLNSDVVKDFYLIKENGDTVECSFVHAERDFGIGPELNLTLAFQEQNPDYDFQLCYNDRIYNNGMVKFTMRKENLLDLPELSNN